MKLLEENIKKILQDVVMGKDFFGFDPKDWKQKKSNINQWE
jgi:hypothetical protein